jgi:sugar lactone lactonase YvrE
MVRHNYIRYLLIAAAWLLPIPAQAVAPARGTVQYLRTIPSVREFTKPRGFFSKLLTLVAGPADDKPEIMRPYATTLDSIGRLLVADPGQKGVHIYDFEKHKYQFLKGPRGRALESPMDVACDTNDDIYVTDSVRKQVYVFDLRGRFLRTIGGSGRPGGDPSAQLQRPTGMVLDRVARRLYLTDTLRHQVLVFGLDGSLIRAIGQRGTGPGEFNYPTALTLSAGKLYVVDAMNFRVQAFTPDGRFLNSFGKPGDQTGTLNRPKGIAADTDGNLYIADASFETVQVFDPDGHLLYYFGSTGTKPGQFQLPSGISITDRNIIYVADSLNRRVQVFRYTRPAQ